MEQQIINVISYAFNLDYLEVRGNLFSKIGLKLFEQKKIRVSVICAIVFTLYLFCFPPTWFSSLVGKRFASREQRGVGEDAETKCLAPDFGSVLLVGRQPKK